jgi:hypothetical protein
LPDCARGSSEPDTRPPPAPRRARDHSSSEISPRATARSSSARSLAGPPRKVTRTHEIRIEDLPDEGLHVDADLAEPGSRPRWARPGRASPAAARFTST